jgi:hypothetical protein
VLIIIIVIFEMFVVQCYADMGEHEVIQLVDCTLRKSDLVKKKNDEVSVTDTDTTIATLTLLAPTLLLQATSAFCCSSSYYCR